MFGGDVPELNEARCSVCERGFEPAGGATADEVVWDAWHTGERRFSAAPLHRRCAADVLPPDAPGDAQRRCGICGQAFAPAALEAAFGALHERFRAPAGGVATPEIVWRLARREPREYLAEHFACVLGKLGKKPKAPGDD